MKEKTYVEDIDRSMYDFRNEEKDAYKVKEGLTPAIVEQISKEKKTRNNFLYNASETNYSYRVFKRT